MEDWERKERTDGRLRRGESEGGDEDSSRDENIPIAREESHAREREKEGDHLFSLINYSYKN